LYASLQLSAESENLLKDLQNYMRVKHYSPRTIKNYSYELRYLLSHYTDRSAHSLTQMDIIHYLRYIQEHFNASWGKCHIAAQALSFFFQHLLQLPAIRARSFYPLKKQFVPSILSQAEIGMVLNSCSGLQQKAIVSVFYGTGIRLSELQHLKLSDIDRSNLRLRIAQGKGNKERYTLLSEKLLNLLEGYWRLYRPQVYLFEGRKVGQPMQVRSIQYHVRCAIGGAGLLSPARRMCCHTLRHSFATHLLDAGTDIPTIQQLLGHSHISTTMVYLHLQESKRRSIVNPLDSYL
jgi:integrase/recombinase XerD